jgi:hypothetical protein
MKTTRARMSNSPITENFDRFGGGAAVGGASVGGRNGNGGGAEVATPDEIGSTLETGVEIGGPCVLGNFVE